MTDENEDYFGGMKLLFLTEGWKFLKEQLQAEIEPLLDIGAIADEKELFYRKGQLLVLRNILNLESLIEQAEQEMTQPQELDLES
jgi:pyocin large subunit-like protein